MDDTSNREVEFDPDDMKIMDAKEEAMPDEFLPYVKMDRCLVRPRSPPRLFAAAVPVAVPVERIMDAKEEAMPEKFLPHEELTVTEIMKAREAPMSVEFLTKIKYSVERPRSPSRVDVKSIMDALEKFMPEKFVPLEEPSCASRPRSPPCDFAPSVEMKYCTFVNDTEYIVMITDKDGTRPLNPGKSTTNVGIPGDEVILVLKLPKKDGKIEFPLSGFNNSRQKISQIFANEINQNQLKQ